MSESKSAAGLMGALALLGASLGVSAAEAQGYPQAQPASRPGTESHQAKIESNQAKMRGAESNQIKGNEPMRRIPGWLRGAGAVADAVRQPSVDSVAGALGAMSSSHASTQAGGGGGAQGGLASLTLDAGARSIAEGGILRCEAGQELDFALTGEDASMERVPLEPHSPKAHSTNDAVVRAAVASHSAYVVNIRCGGDGEAWVIADAGGRRAVYPVLVGRARRQPAMTTQAPAGPALAVGQAQPGQPKAPSLDQVNRAVDAARNVMGIFRR